MREGEGQSKNQKREKGLNAVSRRAAESRGPKNNGR